MHSYEVLRAKLFAVNGIPIERENASWYPMENEFLVSTAGIFCSAPLAYAGVADQCASADRGALSTAIRLPFRVIRGRKKLSSAF